MRTLAIIPARGGSKGVPGKNLRQLAGKPLIAWSIEQALAAAGVTDTVVSTDDDTIAQVARNAGAHVPFLRPAELATDSAPTEPAMLHALEMMEAHSGRYDAVMLLQPTSPFRRPGTIDSAVERFAADDADSLLGVVESHSFFWQTFPEVAASYDFANRPRRQDISPRDRRWRETGSLYMTRRDPFVASRNRLCGRIALFPMTEEESWEIDTEFDFKLLETVFEHFTP